MNEPQRHYGTWKKPDSKGWCHVYGFHLYCLIPFMWQFGKDKTIVRETEKYLISVVATQLYKFPQIYWSDTTLHDPMDCRLSGSFVHGIFQARLLEWIAISFSRGSSRPRNRTRVSRIAGRRFTIWATREAQTYMYIINYRSTNLALKNKNRVHLTVSKRNINQEKRNFRGWSLPSSFFFLSLSHVRLLVTP